MTSKNNDISKAIEEWNGKEGEDAEKFYWENVFPKCRDKFLEETKPLLEGKKYNGLIMTLGTSPEPIILSINALQPKRVCIICTTQTEKFVSLVREHCEHINEEFPYIETVSVGPTNTLEIYEKVLEAWLDWKSKHELEGIAVDVTGGTKSMTSGLAMAAAILSFDLFYVNSEFNPQIRRPNPGTESLVVLPNPYNVFGVVKENEALELFKRNDYNGAALKYGELKKSASDRTKYEALEYLAKGYEALDIIDFESSVYNLNEAKGMFHQLNKMQSNSWLEKLGKQIKTIETIKSGLESKDFLNDLNAVLGLVYVTYNNAEKRAEEGRLDVASLYLYRLLEMLGQRRLAVYGIDTSKPDYNISKKDMANIKTQKDFIEKINEIRDEIDKKMNNKKNNEKNKLGKLESLPEKISLFDAYIMLTAIKDSFALKPVEGALNLVRLYSSINNRNNSILAHGFKFVDKEQYDKFKALIDDLAEEFCGVERVIFNKELMDPVMPNNILSN